MIIKRNNLEKKKLERTLKKVRQWDENKDGEVWEGLHKNILCTN